jgi:hypothetical protein
MKAFAAPSFTSFLAGEVRESRFLFVLVSSFTVVTFASIPAMNGEWALRLSAEDSFYENLTAIFFLAASLICFLVYRRNHNVWYLLLSIFLFMGFGEEISWGQRIFGFSTPEVVDKLNVQHEFNIHNLEPVNPFGFDHVWKTDWRRFFTINTMFRAVCFLYGIVFPLGFMYSGTLRTIIEKTRLPLPPFSFGVFFLIIWVLMRIVSAYTPSGNYFFPWRDANEEISECCTSLVWLAISMFFLKTTGKQSTRPREQVLEVSEPLEKV